MGVCEGAEEDAPAGEVVPMAGDVLALSVRVQLGRVALDYAVALIFGAARSVEQLAFLSSHQQASG